MAGSCVVRLSVISPSGCFAPAWLPPGGHGNGLAADAWAQIGDFDAQAVGAVLDVLREGAVPAYAAAAPAPLRPLTRPVAPPGSIWRLWVGSTSYNKALEVLLRALPRLAAASG